ncbi:MAG: OB-fold domain-containing protein [Solirubrobacterales bacterium]
MSVAPETGLTPAEWWEAAERGHLLVLRCPVCGAAWLPFMPHCPDCGRGSEPRVVESSGRGTIYSWVGIEASISAPDETPFVVASVRLEEGAMIYGRLIGEPSAEGAVRAVFVEHAGRTTVEFETASG